MAGLPKFKMSPLRAVFMLFNLIILISFAIMILFPLYNIIITSFSADKDVMGNEYLLYPKSFSFAVYQRIVNSEYMRAFWNSLGVAVVGTIISVTLTIPMGFALAQKNLVGRKFFLFFIIVPLVVDPGQIPFYVVVRAVGLLDSYASLILPVAITIFDLLLAKNFFRTIPDSLMESAKLDGCSEIGVLWRIVLPVSKPIIAAITLFYFVAYWNRYFEVLMFINDKKKYTLQIVLRELLYISNTVDTGAEGVYNNLKMGVMIMGMLPVLIIYPFIQRYFISGLMLGSIKE
jgi:putative aldouronate transport system permease protein